MTILSAQIRELAGAPPSVEAWTELCALIEALGDELPGAIDAIDALLEGWPDALRRAPIGWMLQLVDGDEVPALLLTRAAELISPSTDELDLVGRSPCLRRLRHLDIVFGGVDSVELIHALDRAPSFASVIALRLRFVPLGGEGGVALASSELLGRLERLELESTEIDEDGISALAASPRTRRLVSLGMNEFRVEGAASLGRSTHFASLRELRLTRLDDADLVPLARSPHLATEVRAPFKVEARERVTRLALRSRPSLETWRERVCPLLSCFEETDFRAGKLDALMEAFSRWPKDVRPAYADWLGWLLNGEDAAPLRLAGAIHPYALRGTGRAAEDLALLTRVLESPALAHITTLDLRYCVLGEEDLLRLVASPLLGRVRALGLDQPLTPRLVDALARAEHARGLTSLTLLGSASAPEALRALLASPLIHRLTALDLPCNALGDEGARALAAAAGLAGLRCLGLRNNSIGDAGFSAIAASPHVANLVELDASENPIGDAGARSLAASAHLSRLMTLKLGYGGRIGDRGALALARSEGLGALQHLGLNFNVIGDRGAVALVTSKRLRTLRRLDICYGNRITTAGALAMALAAPKAPLLVLNLGFGSRISKRGAAALRATSLVREDQEA